MKKYLALVLAICLAASLGTAYGDGNTDEKRIVNVGISMDIASIAPFGAMDGGRAQVRNLIFEPMIQRVAFGATVENMELVCAKSVTKVDDATYDIEMYDYIYDAAGNHITASDYAWAAETMKAEGYYPKLKANLDSVEVTGDYSVRIHLTNPSLGSAEWVLSIVPVISQKAWEESGDKMVSKPITTAVYQVDTFTSGSGIVLVKNMNYWQTDESLRYTWAVANADQLNYHIITESNQMNIALQSGDIDVAAVSANNIHNFYDPATKTPTDGFVVNEDLATMLIGLVFNASPDSVVGNDLALRQAICYGINKEDIVTMAVNGLGQPLTAFANPWASDYNADWDSRDYYNFNIDRAKEKVAESSSGGRAAVKLLTLNNQDYVKAAQVIQANLSEVGITVEINAVDTALYESTSAMPGAWDIQIVGRGCDDFCTFPWSLLFNQGSFAWEGTYNFITAPEQQELYLAAAGLETHSRETVDAFEAYLFDNAWAFGLYTNYNYTVANANVVSELVMRDGGEPIVGACKLVK